MTNNPKSFRYEENSNKVLYQNKPNYKEEATGKVESIKDKLQLKMGDKYRPENSNNNKNQKSNNSNLKDKSVNKNIKVRNDDFFDKNLSGETIRELLYIPKLKESLNIYFQIRNILSILIPDQSSDELAKIVDEVLAILLLQSTNSDSDSRKNKFNMLKELISSLDNEIYDSLNNLANKINDYINVVEDKMNLQKHNVTEIITNIQSDDDDDNGFNKLNRKNKITNESMENDYENEEDDEESSIDNIEDKNIEFNESIDDRNDNDEEKDSIGIENNDNDDNKTLKKEIYTTFKLYGMDLTKKESILNWMDVQITNLLKSINISFQMNDIERIKSQIFNYLKSSNRELEKELYKNFGTENIDLQKFILKNKIFLFYIIEYNQIINEDQKNLILDEIDSLSETVINTDMKEILISILDPRKNNKNSLNEKNLYLDKAYMRLLTSVDGDNKVDKEFRNIREKSKKMKIPENCVVNKQKQFESYTIPPMQNKNNIGSSKELELRQTLNDWMLEAFMFTNKENQKKLITEKFNKVQSAVLDSCLRTDENMLVCAPTSSGKTNIAMLCLLRLLEKFKENTLISEQLRFKLSKIKAVIITPMKALAKETVNNFKNRLSVYGLKINELSGDSNLNKYEMEESNILVATPEKWDIVSRKLNMKYLVDSIQLLIIDEIHLLHDSRGSIIESIVVRTLLNNEKMMKIKNDIDNSNICRIIGLSATFPNYTDVAAFLKVDKKHCYYFDNSYRPVPLEQTFIGVTEKSSIKKINLLNDITFDIIKERIGFKQVIVFVHSRKETFKTGQFIQNKFNESGINCLLKGKRQDEYKEILNEEINRVSSHELKDLLKMGIGIHHAGLNKIDKDLVELLFNNGYIQVIVSTTTLAWGVNLPAQTVIIKNTEIYNPTEGWTQVSFQDVLQMFGRAGRVGYSNEIGEGFIISSTDQIKYYLNALSERVDIESTLLDSINECINAEISLKNISNLKEAINWFNHTYLFIRMIKNPKYYNINSEDLKKEISLIIDSNKKTTYNLLHIVKSDIINHVFDLLEKSSLIISNRKSKNNKCEEIISSSPLGVIASHYYLKYESISIYNKNLHQYMGYIDLFRVFALSSEFKQILVREEEKSELEYLASKVPVPVKGSLEESAFKINVLLQASISQFSLENYSIMSDMVYISQNAERLFRALAEIHFKKNWSSGAVQCINISKMISKKMWNSNTPLRQFAGIAEDLLIKIEKKEKLTWDKFQEMSPHQLGDILGVKDKEAAGKIIHKLIHLFPKFIIEAYIQPVSNVCLSIELIIKSNFNWDLKIHSKVENFWIIIEDNDEENLLYYDLISIPFGSTEEIMKVYIPIINPLPPQYFIKCISDKWINSETIIPISFKNLILPKVFPKYTQLEKYENISIDKIFLNNSNIIEMFKNRNIKSLSSVQIQAFYYFSQNIMSSLYLGCSSGKSLIIELLLLLYLQRQDYLKEKSNLVIEPIVYIIPDILKLKNKFANFKKHFSDVLGYHVYFLNSYNFKEIPFNTRIIFTTIDNLESLSVKNMNKIKSIETFIISDIHLLGKYSNFEYCLTRIKYLNTNAKFWVFSQSISNYDSICAWLQIPNEMRFNFKSSIRPNEVELSITGFDNYSRDIRLISIKYQIFGIILDKLAEDSEKNKFLVVVSDLKEAKKFSIDLLNSLLEKDLEHLLNINQNIDFNNKEDIDIKFSLYLLKNGIKIHNPYINDELNDYKSKDYTVKICIVPIDYICDVKEKMNNLIFYDTQKFSKSQNIYVDYSISEINDAINKITSVSTKSYVYLMCQRSKKDFYKKYLTESFSLESILHNNLPEIINKEINRGVLKSKNNCFDWLTWTYFYHRLSENPNYYNLESRDQKRLSEFLSDVIDNNIDELKNSKMINEIDNNFLLTQTNYGKISTHYGVSYNTILYFDEIITGIIEKNSNKSLKSFSSLIEIISSSPEMELIYALEEKYVEFSLVNSCNNINEDVIIYKSTNIDETLLQTINNLVKYKFSDDNDFNSYPIKSSLLIQSHLTRLLNTQNLNLTIYERETIKNEQKFLVYYYMKLVHVFIDILSSNSLLDETLLATTFSQMIIQGQIINKSSLYQIPYFTDFNVKECNKINVNDINSFLYLDDTEREKILKSFSKSEVEEIANVCNKYPIFEISWSINDEKCTEDSKIKLNVPPDETIKINVSLNRDINLENKSKEIYITTQYFPFIKEENWWVIIGNKKDNTMISIKKIKYYNEKTISINIILEEKKEYDLSLMVISDSWIGCDFEHIIAKVFVN